MLAARILTPTKNISTSFFFRSLSTATKSKIPLANPAFEIPPRLPVHNGFLLDTRPAGERTVINPAWMPKTGKNPLRIEFIDRKDFGLIGQFFVYQFIKHSNFCRHLEMEYEDLEPFFFELLHNVIDKPLSFAAFDEDKLVGIKLNNYHTANEFPTLYPEGLYQSNPKYEIKEDYGEIIKSSPYTLKGNYLYGTYMDLIKNTGKFLPNDCKKVGVLEGTTIHEKYMKCGLIHYFYALTAKVFAESNCDYFTSYCLATATYESAKKIGMKEIFNLPYDELKVDGKIPVYDMYDGATAFRTMLGNVKDSYKIVEKQFKQ